MHDEIIWKFMVVDSSSVKSSQFIDSKNNVVMLDKDEAVADGRRK